mgnify:FL=1
MGLVFFIVFVLAFFLDILNERPKRADKKTGTPSNANNGNPAIKEANIIVIIK